MTFNRRSCLKIIIPCLYVGIAVISDVWDFTVVLMLLGIPWNVPLMMLSGLIVHLTVDGGEILLVGSFTGVMLNLIAYYFGLETVLNQSGKCCL